MNKIAAKMKTAKRIILGILVILTFLPSSLGLELKTYSEDGLEKTVFEPGSAVVFRAAVPEGMDTATIVILKGGNPVETGRMKLFSLKPREIAYSYSFPESAMQGKYTAKMLAKADETSAVSSEFYIGSAEGIEFADASGQSENEEKKSFFQRIWNFIRGLFGK